MQSKTDVLFVKPNNQKKIFQDLSKDFSGIEPPLWLILTAAFIKKEGFSVSVIDAEAENLSTDETLERARKEDPLLVAVLVSGTNPSASTINMPGAGEFLKALHEKGTRALTVISGLHPSALPRRTMEETAADFLIEGEGFYTYRDLISLLKKGNPKVNDFKVKGLWFRKGKEILSNPRADNVNDLGVLPMPAWDLLPMDKYRAHNWHCFSRVDKRTPYAVIYTSLGCPFNCHFCCINSIFGGPGIRYRPVKDVLSEIEYLVKNYKVKNIKILDELFALNWKHVEEICDGLINFGFELNIWVYGRVDTVKDYMLAKMKKAGINWIAYGYEAGSKKVRDGVSKGRFSEKEIKEITRKTHEAGISIVANFIFGLPEDDMETMKETLDLAKDLNCEYANLYCAMAYPGSRLYEDAVKQKLPLPESWSAFSQFSVDCLPLPTKYITSAEVLRFRDAAFDDYFSDPRYLEMIERKFGDSAVNNVKAMREVKLKRKNYTLDNKVYFKGTMEAI
ncbi:MAG: cobalamin-dependent protein [Candidatus Omnitrophica bacterium]|nr:cobalamin-dependent protein [Candidatus Omnitrophota bacterium]